MTNLEALLTLHRINNRIRAAVQEADAAELATTEGATTMIEPKVAKLIQEFDEASNGIAARLQRIAQSQGISEEGAAALEAEAAKLRALGADPADPVPASVTTGNTTGNSGNPTGNSGPLAGTSSSGIGAGTGGSTD